MARRNRKNGQEGHRLAVWGIALSSLAAVLALVYLGLYNTCERIGAGIKDLEKERAGLQKNLVNEQHNWAIARSIPNLQRLMAVHGIALAFPDQKNIIRMAPMEREEPAQYALRGGSSARD